jgi:putative PIN family toxin of toxin-antitoxin system
MPANTKHGVIVDTNLWISFLLASDHSKLDSLIRNDALVLLFSQELIDEFIEVATRPKFRRYFSVTDLQNLLIKMRSKSEFVTVKSEVNYAAIQKTISC